MYPLKFNNLYCDKIWGGLDLGVSRANLPEENIGESWNLACYSHGISIVENGEFN